MAGGYEDPQYWERRYAGKLGNDEWLLSYSEMKHLLQPLGKGHTLVLGCGNSLLGEEMARDGYLSVTNVDISHTVITQMQGRPVLPNLTYSVMDVRDLRYQENSFDIVVDKSTMDCLYCGNREDVSRLVAETYRVLTNTGCYVVLSYGDPQERLPALQEAQWSIATETVEDSEGPFDCHYCYICRKSS